MDIFTKYRNMKVYRGDTAINILTEIKGKFTDENILKWRNVCCVNPSIGCKNCPVGSPPQKEGWGWCHTWYEASVKLRLRRRLESIKKYVWGE